MKTTCVATLQKFLRAAFYNLVRSPLRHVPGPIPAKLSGLWIIAITVAGRRALYVHKLHQRYGPVVRVGPNELSFASAAAVRDLYIGVSVDADADGDTDVKARHVPREKPPSRAPTNASDSDGDRDSSPLGASLHEKRSAEGSESRRAVTTTKTFPKAFFYDLLPPSVGTLRDEAAHSARLKRVGYCFSASPLRDMEPVVRAELALLLRALEQRRGETVDVLHWFRMFSCDVAGQLFLGKTFGALTCAEPPRFAEQIKSVVHSWVLQNYLPWGVRMLRLVPIKALRDFLDAANDVNEYGSAAFRDFIARHGRTPTSRLPLARLVSGDPAKGVPPLPDDEITREVTIMIAAGTDTTATTLAYVFFELARHPEWYARLRAEVCTAADAAAAATAATGAERARNASDTAPFSQHDPKRASSTDEGTPLPPHATLKALPVLHAVVWETLRMHPAIVGALLREAPRGGALVTVAAGGAGGAGRAGGASDDRRVVEDGCSSVWVPAGTTVSAQAYSLQRNPHAFPQPDEWQPARWLARAATPAEPLFPAACLGATSSSLQPSPVAPPNPGDDDKPGPRAGKTGDGMAHDAFATSGDEKNSHVAGSGTGGMRRTTAGDGVEAGRQDNCNGKKGDGGLGDAYSIYESEAMRAHMFAFSRGVRTCLGRGIALVEVKLATAALAQRFAAVRLADARQTVADMRATDRMVLVPAGKRCRLVLE